MKLFFWLAPPYPPTPHMHPPLRHPVAKIFSLGAPATLTAVAYVENLQ